jgi:methanogen homoaconitase small subunit
LEKGIIVNETKNIEVEFQAFKEFMINILSDGGLVKHYLAEKE